MRTDLLIFIIAACEMEINNCLIRQKVLNHSDNSVDPHGWEESLIHSDKYTQTQTYIRLLHNMYDIRVNIYRCNINQEHIYK